MKSNYTVWVGGSEATDHLLTLQQATQVAEYYSAKGYTDVVIEKVEDNE